MRKKRKPDLTGFIVAAAAAVSPALAFGQIAVTGGDPIAECRNQFADKDDRIACLEGVISDLTGVIAAMEGDAGNAVVAESNEVEDAEVTIYAEAAASAPEIVEPLIAEPPKPEGLGAEQVIKREREQAGLPRQSDEERAERTAEATIVDFAYTSLNDLIVFLDNGQIWRQKVSDRNKIRLRKGKTYTVTLSDGAISGYRMRINEIKRLVLVERIK